MNESKAYGELDNEVVNEDVPRYDLHVTSTADPQLVETTSEITPSTTTSSTAISSTTQTTTTTELSTTSDPQIKSDDSEVG